MGWSSWVDMVAQKCSQRDAVRAALTRWLKQALSQAYNAWLDRTNEAKHMEWKMTQSLVSWCLRDMVKGFNKWRYVAWAWKAKVNAAEMLMQGKVLEAYQVPVPESIISLTQAIPAIEDYCASALN